MQTRSNPWIVLAALAVGIVLVGGVWQASSSSDRGSETGDTAAGEAAAVASEDARPDLTAAPGRDGDRRVERSRDEPEVAPDRLWVAGRVVAKEAALAVPDAVIDVWALLSSEGPELHFAGRTDSEGNFCIECRLPPEHASEHREWRWGLRVWAPGRVCVRPEPELLRDPAHANRILALERTNGRAHGRVVDALGRPCPGADINLVRLGADGRRQDDADSRAQADELGRFDLEFREPVPFAINAWSRTRGSVWLPPLTPILEEVNDLGDLVLTGVGEIGGRLITPSGEPVQEIWLGAVRADVIGADSWTQDPHAPECTVPRVGELHAADGLLVDLQTTGKDGGFRFAGMQPGEWIVYVADPRIPAGRWPLSTGTSGAVLQIPSHCLEVVIELEEGLDPRALSEFQILCQRVGTVIEPDDLDAWLEPQIDGLWLRAVDVDDLRVSFFVEPGHDYEVGLMPDANAVEGPSFHCEPQRVSMTPDRHHRKVTLSVETATRLGKARIQSGNAELLEEDRLEWTVSRADRQGLVAHGSFEARSSVEVSLPQGQYVLRLDYARNDENKWLWSWRPDPTEWAKQLEADVAALLPHPDHWTDVSLASGYWLPSEAWFEVRVDQTVGVEAPLTLGGRVLTRWPRARVDAGSDEADPQEELSFFIAIAKQDTIARSLLFSRLYPDREHQDPDWVDFLGNRCLPAGRWSLELQLGKESKTVELEIRPRQITLVEGS